MAIKVSYYGSKKPAPNVKPQRVIKLADNTPRDKLPFGGNNPIDWMTGKHLFQLKKEEPVEMPEPVEIRSDKSIVINADGALELDGDQATPGADKLYGTDANGSKTWRDAPKSIPDGDAESQLLVWDNETKTWGPELIKLLPDGSADGETLVWDNDAKTWAPELVKLLPDGSKDKQIAVWDNDAKKWVISDYPLPPSFDGYMLIYDDQLEQWVPRKYLPPTDDEEADSDVMSFTHYPRSIQVDKRVFAVGGGSAYCECLMLYDFWSASNKTGKTLVDLLTGNPAIRNKCKVVIRYHDDDDDGRSVVTYLPLGQLLTPPTVPDPDTVKGGITNGKSINFTGSNAYQIFNFFTGPSDGMTLPELVDPETLPADKNKYKLLARKDEVTGPEVAYVDIGDLSTLPDGTADGQLMQWNATSEEWELVETSTITVMTGWRLNKSTHRFQVKTTEIEVVTSGTQSAWTDISDADGGILDEGTPL